MKRFNLQEMVWGPLTVGPNGFLVQDSSTMVSLISSLVWGYCPNLIFQVETLALVPQGMQHHLTVPRLT